MTRQELYDQIRQSSKEQVILDGMIRLGFWDSDSDMPSVPEQFIRRQTELQQELRSLLTEQRNLKDPKKMLKQMRKERLKASRDKQKETKERHARERQERADAWAAKKKIDITYLGESVSSGLNFNTSDKAVLEANNLPFFANVADLAAAMNISVGELRFLSFQRKVSKVHHYKRFALPKKTGGVREISAPMPRLKQAQYWVLHHILYKIAPHEAAHGFVPTRSIVSNAQKHVGAETVVNIDLKDFFPTITYKRVKGVFLKLGYSPQMATIFSLLCTEIKADEVMLDGQRYFVQSGERVLPQGAPTSPAITNILCRGMDKALNTLAGHYRLNYSRYADDMTFSGKFVHDEVENELQSFMKSLRHIIDSQGFILHPDKVRIMGRSKRQEVTGIVVNEKPSLEAKKLKAFRALLFQIEKDGLKGKTWNGKEGMELLHTLYGFANYVNMVHPEKGARFVEQAQAIWLREKQGIQLSNSTISPDVISTAAPEAAIELPQAYELPQSEVIEDLPENDDDAPSWKLW